MVLSRPSKTLAVMRLLSYYAISFGNGRVGSKLTTLLQLRHYYVGLTMKPIKNILNEFTKEDIMPGNTTAMHPNTMQITFTESDHSYVDNLGMDYTSVTTLIHKAFPVFDAEKIAARKAAKDGGTAQSYLDLWEKNRNRAALEGTRMHENCEHQILGQYDKMHKPANQDERLRFAAAWNEVECLQTSQPLSIEPEKIVFSPIYNIAGSIDLLIQRQDGTYIIADWKVVKELKRQGFNNEMGTAFATRNLHHCNWSHYALQLSIYHVILKLEGYIPESADVEHWLFIYDREEHTIKHEKLPILEASAALLLLQHVRLNAVRLPEEIPF
jgi:hypothetical protein